MAHRAWQMPFTFPRVILLLQYSFYCFYKYGVSIGARWRISPIRTETFRALKASVWLYGKKASSREIYNCSSPQHNDEHTKKPGDKWENGIQVVIANQERDSCSGGNNFAKPETLYIFWLNALLASSHFNLVVNAVLKILLLVHG